jgi:hypothetical protein
MLSHLVFGGWALTFPYFLCSAHETVSHYAWFSGFPKIQIGKNWLKGGKCKSITFSRLRHPFEFSYMLGGVILDCVDSIDIDLEVIMDIKMSFAGVCAESVK